LWCGRDLLRDGGCGGGHREIETKGESRKAAAVLGGTDDVGCEMHILGLSCEW